MNNVIITPTKMAVALCVMKFIVSLAEIENTLITVIIFQIMESDNHFPLVQFFSGSY